jgi:hypothetical protein
MKIITHEANSHTIRLDGKEAKLLLISDVHYDSKDCHRDLLKSHMKEADYILCFGDWFDVMGCYKDPRSKGQDVRPEYLSQSKAYLDLIVEDAYNFLLPFKDKLLFMGSGNHESAIVKHRDTDILNTLCFLLRTAGSPVVKGGYSGYINFSLKPHTTSEKTVNKLLAYHHGYGGNAPRSKGILRSQMDALNWSDADIIVSGHDHNKLHDFNVVYKRNIFSGKIDHITKDWIKLGNYKRNDQNPGIGGWAVEKGFMPKPIGGYFCELHANFIHETKEDGTRKQLLKLDTKIYEAK